MPDKMTTIKKLAMIALLLIISATIAIPAVEADEISIATGLVTVNGHPQGNVTVTGFGSSAETEDNGRYVLKFQDQGYGVITASYGGHNVSSGLILLPSSPVIKMRDLDIAISDASPAGDSDVSEGEVTAQPGAGPVWVAVPEVQASDEAPQVPGQPDIQSIAVLLIGACCAAFICFLAFLTARN